MRTYGCDPVMVLAGVVPTGSPVYTIAKRFRADHWGRRGTPLRGKEGRVPGTGGNRLSGNRLVRRANKLPKNTGRSRPLQYIRDSPKVLSRCL